MQKKITMRVKNQNKLISKITPEKTFIILAFIFGIIFSFVSPPFQVGDEASHLYRIYELSEAKIIAKKIGNYSGDYIPKGIVSMALDIEGGKHFSPQKDYFNQNLKKYLNKKTDFKDTQLTDFRNTVLYTPIVYLPQVAGMCIAKAINYSPLLMLYLGRLFNLLGFMILSYYAIKITPVYKWGLTLIALTPMTLYESSSLSADAVCFGLCFLFTAFILKYAFSKDKFVTNKNLISIFVMSILLVMCKSAYVFLIFLFFLIPIKKIGTKKKYILTFLTIATVCTIFSALWAYLINTIYLPFMPWSNPHAQFAYVVSHPIKFISAIFEFFNFFYTDFFISFVGNFGREIDCQLPRWFVLTYINILILTAIFENNKDITINLRQKCVAIITVMLNITAIDFLLYLAGNRVGDNYIEGLVGRYYTPIAILYFIPFYNKLTNKVDLLNNGGNIFLTCFLTLSLCYTTYVLLNRYYLF